MKDFREKLLDYVFVREAIPFIDVLLAKSPLNFSNKDVKMTAVTIPVKL